MIQLFEIAETILFVAGSNSCHKPKATIIAPTKTIGSIFTPFIVIPHYVPVLTGFGTHR